MKKIDYKKSYKSKEVLRLALSIVLILIQSILFFYVWMNYYVPLMRNVYSWKGNTFIVLIYAVIFTLFLVVFDNYLSSNNKISTIIISLSISNIINNILVYFTIIVPTTINDKGIASMIPMFWMTCMGLIINVLWAFIVCWIRKKIYPPLPMLFISNKENIDTMLLKFNERKDIYNIVDSIDCNVPLNEIEDKCKKFANVVIGDIPADLRNDIVKFCFDYGINSYMLPKLSDILIRNTANVFVIDSPMFLAQNEGITGINEIAKRCMDIIISLMVLILFFWLFIIVAILIKIEDGGKIFFIQERVTKDEKLFKLIKFRSMVMDVDNSGVNPTTKEDKRITKIGKFIRRFHIDELPQVVNVLVGDMSIVGPRPERKEHVEQYEKEISEFVFRYKVKGGLTGLAQVYGKYNTSAYDKIKLDLIYIRDYSLLLDIELILKTIQVIFSKEHVEAFSEDDAKKIHDNSL